MTATATGAFSAQHATALAMLRENGAPVTFTAVAKTHDPTTDVVTDGVTTSVAGYAVRSRGTPREYERDTLVQGGAVTLLFCPTAYGERPALGSTVVWEGATQEVVAIDPVAPDGTDIVSRVLIGTSRLTRRGA